MAEIYNSQYPVFDPDQILSNGNLNDMMSYVDYQNTLTRTELVGNGIVCGLVATYESGEGSSLNIKVTLGHGVTKGALKFDKVIDGKTVETVTEESYAYVGGVTAAANPKVFTNMVNITKPFTEVTPESLRTHFYELLTTDEAAKRTDENPQLISSTLLTSLYGVNWMNELVIGVYVDVEDINSDNCSTADCNDKGKTRMVTSRVVIAPASYFNEAVAGEKSTMEYLRIFRAFPLLRVTTYDQYLTNFRTTIDQNFIKIDACLNLLTSTINPALAPLNTQELDYLACSADWNTIKGRSNQGAYAWYIQYFYDFQRDFEQCYNELILLYNQLQKICGCDNVARKPQWLVMGSFHGSGITENLRYKFIGFNNGCCNPYDELKKAYIRISLLIKAFKRFLDSPQAEAASGIQLTPSKYGPAYFARRAIPYYFYIVNDVNFKELFLRYWKVDITFDDKDGDINRFGAFLHSESSTDPLSHDLREYPFIRIEGLVGRDYKTVYNTLVNIINDKNLAISILKLNLASTVPPDTSGCGIVFANLFNSMSRNQQLAVVDKQQNANNKAQLSNANLQQNTGSYGAYSNYVMAPQEMIINKYKDVVFQDDVKVQAPEVTNDPPKADNTKTEPMPSGMEHLAGAFQGNTFVILTRVNSSMASGEEVVGDVTLPYFRTTDLPGSKTQPA